jgi:hypothetical protein
MLSSRKYLSSQLKLIVKVEIFSYSEFFLGELFFFLLEVISKGMGFYAKIPKKVGLDRKIENFSEKLEKWLLLFYNFWWGF